MPTLLDAAPFVATSASETGSRKLRRLQPAVALGVAVYGVSTCALLTASWVLCGHRFIYPLDDTYITMAVAKNFAMHGVWGLSPYQFNSTTSSPIFVLLLSGVYRLFGVNDYAPALLSWLFGLLSLLMAASIIPGSLRLRWRLVTLIAVVVLTPLFVLGTIGMEHTLHLFAVLVFLASFQSEKIKPWQLAVATMLMCAARYEGLLMAAAAVLLMAVRRRWVSSAIVAISAWIPVGAYACFSIAHGGSWLPNSVLLKVADAGAGSPWQHLVAFGLTGALNASRAPHLALMSVAIVLLGGYLWNRNPGASGMLLVVGVAGLLHLTMGAVGWVFRYESYLIAAGIVAIANAATDLHKMRSWSNTVALSLLLLAGCVLALRSSLAVAQVPLYSRAIYRQQWQMAQFLKLYYPGAAVAANDVGLISYESDLHCLDLAGLASSEVLRAKREGTDTTPFLEHLARAHHVQVVLLYESWFSNQSSIRFGGPALPQTWHRVSRWTSPERLQLGDRTVSFFGIDERTDKVLGAKLKEFEPSLPAVVKVSQ